MKTGVLLGYVLGAMASNYSWQCTRKTLRCSESCTKQKTVAWQKDTNTVENSTIFKSMQGPSSYECSMLLIRSDSYLANDWNSWDEFIKTYVRKGIKLKQNSKRRASSSRVLHLMFHKKVLHFKITIKARALKCKTNFECRP